MKKKKRLQDLSEKGPSKKSSHEFQTPFYKYLKGLPSGKRFYNERGMESHYWNVFNELLGEMPQEQAEMPLDYLMGFDSALQDLLPGIPYLRIDDPSDAENYLSADDFNAFKEFILTRRGRDRAAFVEFINNDSVPKNGEVKEFLKMIDDNQDYGVNAFKKNLEKNTSLQEADKTAFQNFLEERTKNQAPKELWFQEFVEEAPSPHLKSLLAKTLIFQEAENIQGKLKNVLEEKTD